MIEVNDFADRIFNYFFVRKKRTRVVIPIYLKWKELMLYGFFGLQTFLLGIISYAFLTEVLCWDVLVANVCSWIFTTLFAFLTNRKWVFPHHRKGAAAFFIQLWSFTAARIFTLGIEELALYLFIRCLHLPNMPVKTVVQIVVITLNYFFSKIIVFGRKAPVQ